jgi:hypothetical protein
MTRKAWGHTQVSSALEVYNLLASGHADVEHWQTLLTIEPPTWGAVPEHAPRIAYLISRGFRVWSWDDHGVALSSSARPPPHDLHYRCWDFYFDANEEEPTQPTGRKPVGVADANEEEPTRPSGRKPVGWAS